MPRRKVANPLALAVLACLAERPMHPYEMASTMRERGKHESIKLNYGSLYTVVESLQKHDLIAPQETVKEGRRPERTVYAITEAGRLEYTDWLSELLSTPVKEFSAFEAGLSLAGGLPPEDVLRLLTQRAALLQAEINGNRTMLEYAREQGVPRLFLIEGDYRIALKETELEFVRKLAASIADGSLEGIDYWREAYRQFEAGEVITAFEPR